MAEPKPQKTSPAGWNLLIRRKRVDARLVKGWQESIRFAEDFLRTALEADDPAARKANLKWANEHLKQAQFRATLMLS